MVSKKDFNILRYTRCTYTPQNINEGMYPAMNTIIDLFLGASSYKIVRREVYKDIVRLAIVKESYIAAAMAEIHHLMRGHEMNHLTLIDKYILEELSLLKFSLV